METSPHAAALAEDLAEKTFKLVEGPVKRIQAKYEMEDVPEGPIEELTFTALTATYEVMRPLLGIQSTAETAIVRSHDIVVEIDKATKPTREAIASAVNTTIEVGSLVGGAVITTGLDALDRRKRRKESGETPLSLKEQLYDAADFTFGLGLGIIGSRKR